MVEKNEQLVGLSGVVAFCCAVLILRVWPTDIQQIAFPLLVFVCGISMAVTHIVIRKFNLCHGSLRTVSQFGNRQSLRLSPSTGFQIACTKTVGLLCVFSLLGGIYAILPEYRSPHYAIFFPLALPVAFVVLLLAVPYFFMRSLKASNPYDGYWHFGLLCTGRRDKADCALVRPFLMAWGVKGFFLPFMLGGVAAAVPGLINPVSHFQGVQMVVSSLVSFLFTIDVTLASVGYMATLKPLGTEIRSTEPTLAGWCAALICYPPANKAMPFLVPAYTRGPSWDNWLNADSPIFIAWAITLIFLLGIYVWATVAFGLRFSNLTNRGIIRHGPYAWVKHPAYISKNLFWWLSFTPFVAGSTLAESLTACTGLLLVNAIYYARAKTEERHLSNDRHYRLYLRWLARHGLLANLKKLFSAGTPRYRS